MINIILATYNGEKYIDEQIKSIFDSRYKNFRVFVFDDGSEDNTVPLLEEWEKKNILTDCLLTEMKRIRAQEGIF